MQTGNFHLTYCTNVHPTESWEETFLALRDNLLPLKERVSPDNDFGVGLRLSNQASIEILEKNNLQIFQTFLHENGLYVFTLNGFPYGNFHKTRVKEKVYSPDWATSERYEYTLRLIKILAELLPDGMEGGISTLPLSYRFWFDEKKELEAFYEKAVEQLCLLVAEMAEIYEKTGKQLHLDLEPEPDCLLQESSDVIDFFVNRLIPSAPSEVLIKQHIQVCYDVCHFAVRNEKPWDVFQTFQENGIQVGKVQISSALKAAIPTNKKERKELHERLQAFVDPVYLHQTIIVGADGKKMAYRDLPDFLNELQEVKGEELRVHFHLPIFFEKKGEILTTQNEIIEVLQCLKENALSPALEIETYTWDVLPDVLKEDLISSLEREINWLKRKI